MERRIAILTSMLALVGAESGCLTKDCTDGTIFVELTRTGAGAKALDLDVTVTFEGSDGTPKVLHSQPKQLGAMEGSTSFAIAFPGGYPAGKTATVTVSGKENGIVVSSDSKSPKLEGSCIRLALTLGDGITSDDLGVIDTDGGADFAGCVPTVTSCPATQTCGRVDDGCGGFVDCAKPCDATSVSPRLANTGDTIAIEGTFTAGATVDFPGAPGTALTLAGEHRATAVVPATATAGSIVVHSGSMALSAGNFRRASYALSLLGFDISQPQTTGGMAPVFLKTPRKYETLVESNGWIYALGGSQNSSGSGSPTASVERVRVNADGSLGYTEELTASHLAIARYGHAALVIGDHLYVFGGTDGTTAFKSYEWATIKADGTLSSFTLVDNALTDARSFLSVHVIGGDVYLFAGRNDNGLDLGTVEHAPIAADRSLGAFVALPAANNLTQPRRGHASFITSSQVVIIGGTIGGSDLAKIESAPIMGDGTLGAFANSAQVLPNPASNLTGVQWGNKLFALPYISTVAADGSFGAFTDAGVGVIGSNHSGETRVVIVRDTPYMLTGTSTDQTTYDLFARGSLSGGAQLDAFTISSTAAVPNGRRSSVGAAIGDSLYLFGGGNKAGSTPTILRAPVNPDDSIGNFADTGTQIDGARTEHAIAVARNHVYVLGGLDAGNTQTSAVAYAPINADGTIGTFTATSSLTAPRSGLSAFVIGNVLCTVGGYTGSGYSSVFECAQIAADGSLSAFAVPNSIYTPPGGAVHIATARAWFTVAVTSSKVLIVGGGNSSSPTTIEGTNTYNVGSTMAENFGALAGVTLPSPRYYHTSLFVGYWLYTLAGFGTNAALREDTRTLNTQFAADTNANLVEAIQGATSVLVGNRAYVIGGVSTSDPLTAIETTTLK